VITTLPVVVAPESVAPDSRPMGRLEFIDGLRGTAVVMVILAHFYPRAYSFGLPRWADCFSLGYLGVHLFLLLSGFCVAWAYLGSPPRPFSVADFAKRRALRILPAYYVALLISAALAAPDYGAVEFARQLLVHAVMLHNLSPSTALAFNPPFWSLALECQLYVCFPLMIVATGSRPAWPPCSLYKPRSASTPCATGPSSTARWSSYLGVSRVDCPSSPWAWPRRSSFPTLASRACP